VKGVWANENALGEGGAQWSPKVVPFLAVTDTRLAAATKMDVQDVRDWLETLEGKGFVERARRTDGFTAYVTARGKQALRMTEPIANSAPGAAVAGSDFSNVVTSSGTAKAAATQNLATAPKPPERICVFFSYSPDDKPLRDKMAEHLSLLKRQGVISTWYDRMIVAGDERKVEIDKRLEEARVILLLISSSFMSSDYCYDIEMKRSIERHDQGEARVIPVLIRACDWESAPFARLTVLPTNRKAVTSWPNQEEAWTDIALGIRRAVEAMTENPR
jgi:DNA-binding MarR family transcriptional regulator